MEIIKYLSPIADNLRLLLRLSIFSLEVIKESERKQILNHHDGTNSFKKAPFAGEKMNDKSYG